MKMYTRGFFVALIVTAFIGQAAAAGPNFGWSKKGGGTGRDQGYALTTDGKGNVYVTGEFTSTGTFAPAVSLVSAGNVDFFLVKYDSAGNALWGKKGGGTLTDRGYGVVVGLDGNPVVTGHYYGASTFDTVTVTSSGNLDAFIAKYNAADGKLLWLKEGKSVSQTSPRAITADAQGNYIVGGYYGTSTALTATFDNITLTSAGQRDIYIVKYNKDGVIQWGVSAGGPASGEEVKDITCDPAGNIYVTGIFTDTSAFGSTTLYGRGGADIFVAKYSPAGNLVWAKSIGGKKEDEGSAIALDASGNIYVGGRIDSAAVFDANTSVLSAGGYDAFIAKYDNSGNLLWVKLGGGTGNDYTNGIVCDQAGVIGVGSFLTSAVFGGTTVTSAGAEDLYFIRYKSNGDFDWIKTAGGAEKETANRIVLAADGSAYATGNFRSTATFGSDALTTTGVEDVFLTKLTNAGVIPVELASFTAAMKGNYVNLNWMTATESNNSGFEIQRSADKTNFVTIGTVAGKGTTAEKSYYSFVDKSIGSDKYYYRLKQNDFDGTSSFSGVVEVNISQPSNYMLAQNYPNPFNPSTVISYQLPADSKVTLKVYDVLGKEITSLVNGYQAAGRYNVKFDAGAKSLSSGVYYYRLQVNNLTGGFTETKKMILNK
jgi:hypothetical protein